MFFSYARRIFNALGVCMLEAGENNYSQILLKTV